MSAPTTPSRPEGLAGRLKSFRNPTRAFTMAGRPASPSPTPERPTPTRSSTRDPSPAKSRIPLFGSRKSGSAAPSTDAVNEIARKDEPATDAPKQEPATPGHTRARSGSTVSSQGPMTPPPAAQTSEPIAIPKTEDPISDSPHDGASLASSRSPSRLRRKVSNLSRHSVSGSIRRLSLLGPSSPPQVEVTPVVATASPQAGVSRSASISSLRRHASPEPGQQSKLEEPAPVEPAAAEPAPQVESTQVEPAPQAEVAPQTEVAPPVGPAPQVESAPSVEPAQVEAPKVEAAPQPEPVPAAAPQSEAAPVKETTPAPSTKAPSTSEAPKPAEPKTPVKPSASRNASTTSLGRSPTPDKPEPKRRGTLTNWARKSLDRRSSVSSPPPIARPPSRGPGDSAAESDNESLKERERKWGSGLPVPKAPTPKKSEENIKRRFSLGRRSSESGHAKTPSESASESDKKPNWASKMLRAGSKSKKEKGDGSSTTPESSTLDVSSEQAEAQPRPSLSIPDARSLPSEQRPLSAIVESPVAPNMQAWASPISGAMVSSPLAAAATTESPVVVKAEEPSPETSPVVVQAEPETPAALVAEPESVSVEVVAAPAVTEATTTAEVAPVEASAVIAVEPESEQPKDAVVASAEEVAEPGTSTPPVDTEVAPEPAADNVMSPMSPNSPSSPPCDINAQREIARARSPRPGPSANRSLRTSPAPSIIGVKRKQPDEPEAVGKSRVRYLPDWAVSPAIQLAVTLSLVLPRRRRDVANPTNRKRGWWPLRRSGPRTELRYNAIRGVNEEVPIVSKSWTVPAAVRTTAKVVTAPASAVHPEPLPALRRTYESTLSVVSQMPSHAVYRQGTEAILKHRLDLIEKSKGDASEVERALGEGQIEEVLMSAESELSLAEKMLEWKAWEPLEVKPAPGQWEYVRD